MPLSKTRYLVQQLEVVLQPDFLPEEIGSGGEAFLVALYGGEDREALNLPGYTLFVRASASNKTNLARLPPTKAATRLLLFKRYHQVQQWLGVSKTPTDWGWHQTDSGLMSTTTSMPPAPQLKSISCKCKKGCNGSCSCRKAGIKCSILCKYCEGSKCTNVPSIEDVEDGDDLDDDTEEVFDLSCALQMGSKPAIDISPLDEVDLIPLVPQRRLVP